MKTKIIMCGLVSLLTAGLVASCGSNTTSDDTAGDKDDTTIDTDNDGDNQDGTGDEDINYCPEEEEPPIDDSKKYDYSNFDKEAKVVNGQAQVLTGAINTFGSNNLIVDTETPFPYGTISVDIKTNANSDTGIVFNVEDNGNDKFWENTVAYYFFFLNKDGYAYLGKANYGAWQELKSIPYLASVSSTETYNLKVVLKDTKILCFINNELMFGYKDNERLVGTSFGFRSSTSGCSFTGYSITNDYIY